MIADALPGDVNIDSLVFDPTTGTFVERTEPAYISEWPAGNYAADAGGAPAGQVAPSYPIRQDQQSGIRMALAALDDIVEPDDFEHYVRSVTDELAELILRKHDDYGPYNIAASPGGALNGIRVRLHDKFARLNNLIDTGRSPRNESVRDTWVDIAGYAVIALLVSDDRWPA